MNTQEAGGTCEKHVPQFTRGPAPEGIKGIFRQNEIDLPVIVVVCRSENNLPDFSPGQQ